MKSSLCVLILSVLLAGCTNSDTHSKEMNAEIDTIIYAPVDYKLKNDFKIINIENEEYHLYIYRYCLNDSLLKRQVNTPGAINLDHNYGIELILDKVDGGADPIFREKINKEIFKDSLSEEFYQKATIYKADYQFVRANRLYFYVTLSIPKTSRKEKFMCAIFFRTEKISQIEYWKE